jgi:hypothetical protein
MLQLLLGRGGTSQQPPHTQENACSGALNGASGPAQRASHAEHRDGLAQRAAAPTTNCERGLQDRADLLALTSTAVVLPVAACLCNQSRP